MAIRTTVSQAAHAGKGGLPGAGGDAQSGTQKGPDRQGKCNVK